MQAASTLTLAKQPLAVTAAEDTQGWNGITLPVSDKSTGYPDAPGGAGFVSQWGYVGFFYSFFTQLTMENNGDVDMSTVASLASSSSEGTRVLFTENHDMVRWWERAGFNLLISFPAGHALCSLCVCVVWCVCVCVCTAVCCGVRAAH